MQRIFEALSSPVRRSILAYLSHADLTAGEIAGRFDISKPAVSQHLTVLEAAGLVAGRKRGQYVHYRLVREGVVGALTDFLQQVRPSAPVPPQAMSKVGRGARPASLDEDPDQLPLFAAT